MNTRNARGRIAATVLAVGAVGIGLGVAAPAAQAHGVERELSGTCSAGAVWDLNVEREHGLLDIDFEIEQATPGESWTVSFVRNGTLIGKRVAVADRRGEVEVDRNVRAVRGVNRIDVRATGANGQTCHGSIRI